jgi:ABC-2 type transport system ATP-binding protein
VRRLIQDLGEERTVIISSHILPEIEAVCPRVLILSHGKLAADGTQEELVSTLGHASFVRLELAAVEDLSAVSEELVRLKDVLDVDSRRGSDGQIEFDVRCDEDLRASVGRLAQEQNWRVHELSWRKATLEELFVRIALDLDAAQPESEASAEEVAQ